MQLRQGPLKDTSDMKERFFLFYSFRTRDGKVGSANATTALCHPPTDNRFLILPELEKHWFNLDGRPLGNSGCSWHEFESFTCFVKASYSRCQLRVTNDLKCWSYFGLSRQVILAVQTELSIGKSFNLALSSVTASYLFHPRYRFDRPLRQWRSLSLPSIFIIYALTEPIFEPVFWPLSSYRRCLAFYVVTRLTELK